jgi:hypothetical protein
MRENGRHWTVDPIVQKCKNKPIAPLIDVMSVVTLRQRDPEIFGDAM